MDYQDCLVPIGHDDEALARLGLDVRPSDGGRRSRMQQRDHRLLGERGFFNVADTDGSSIALDNSGPVALANDGVGISFFPEEFSPSMYAALSRSSDSPKYDF